MEKWSFYSVASSALLCGLGATADAQAAESDKVDEIVVQARRQSESLQEVPASVSIVRTTKELRNVADLTAVVPGLTGSFGSQVNPDQTPAYGIRGQSEPFAGSSPAVVAYTDEVPSFTTSLYDMGDIQVLKGPQGTLFGKNTTGGAILLTTREPTNDFSGYIHGQFGNYSTHDFDFAVGGPLMRDKLSVRFAGQVLREDGYVENIANPSEGFFNKNRESFRLSILATPTDGIRNLAVFQYDHINENGIVYPIENVFPRAPQGNPGLPAVLAEQMALGHYKVDIKSHDPDIGAPFEHLNKWGVLDRAEWGITDSLTLKNIFSYTRSNNSYLTTTGTGLRSGQIETGAPGSPEGWVAQDLTEELQASYRSKWFQFVVGGFFAQEKRPDGTPSTAFQSLSSGIPNYTAIEGSAYPNLDRDKAGYASFTMPNFLVKDLELSLGARYTSVELSDFKFFAFYPGFCCSAPRPLNVVTPPQTVELNEHATTWSGSLKYSWTDREMTYATISRGFKQGGINAIPDPRHANYAPEFVINYEIGQKSQFNLGSAPARVNVALFYDQFTNAQRFEFVNSLAFITNAAKAVITGIDLDGTVRPLSWLDVGLQYSYVHTKYNGSYIDATLGDLSQSHFVNTPEHQVSLNSTVHFNDNISLTANYYWQSQVWYAVPNKVNGTPANDNFIVGSVQVGTTQYVNLRADWRNFLWSNLTVGAYANNLTNSEYTTGGNNNLNTFGRSGHFWNQPRTYGVNLRYDF